MAVDLTPVYDALRKADAAGDTDGAQKLAAYIKAQSAPQGRSFDLVNGQPVPTGSPEARAAQSPVSDSALENFRTATGKGLVDLGRGAGQMLGLESRQNVADARARDAPLMNTTAGKAGDLFGTAAGMLPAALIPGAGTLAGASAIGAGTGLLQPSTSTGETLANVGLGAAGGPAGLAIGRAGGALWQAGRSALEPFLSGGPERIASRVVQQFAGGAQPAAQAAASIAQPRDILPGVTPSTAELANNPGLNQLQRSLANQPEFNTALTLRDQANRAAMANAVQGIAGTDAQRAVNAGLRRDFSAPYYQQASAARVPVDDRLNRILTRPVMEQAWNRAEALAANNDETLVRPQMAAAMGRPVPIHGAPPLITGNALQYLKMGLQDLANTGPQRGIGAHEQAAVRSTLDDLNGWIQGSVPALRQADRMYAWASRPINQQDVGGELANRLIPALNDFAEAPVRQNAQAFANAVRNGDQLAANATGNANATLAGTMTPAQMTTLRQVGEQLARRAAVNDVGRAAGSNTAQNLIGNNFIQQTLGPLGLPQNAFGRVLSGVADATLGRGAQFLGRTAEPDIQRFLQEAALNPEAAQRLLQMHPNSRIAQLLWRRQGLLGPMGNTAALGLMGSGNAAKQ